ncbi:MAG: ketoacyl-ACP synthase III [Opitutaceae bacterium]|jgi:3-oxoacyl-[acyl-carrier-protein] synthase-3|nr:ketoacyl-ACP synthase III [Opitutaceae bacterium]
MPANLPNLRNLPVLPNLSALPASAAESLRTLRAFLSNLPSSIFSENQRAEREPPKIRRVAIRSTGSCLPDRVVTNAHLARAVDTTDEWIRTRTGIRERRIATRAQATSDLAAAAARNALSAAGLAPADIDLVIVATVTPDHPLPATACLLQHKLGIPTTAACFDLNAACTGFLYALSTASALLAAGRHRRALVVASEKLSSITDWTDRATCVLFGDAAGAALLEPVPDDSASRLLDIRLQADGGLSNLLMVPAGGSAHPVPNATHNRFIRMNGREVFKNAVRQMAALATELLEANNLTPDRLDHFIPHQANRRIIDALAEQLRVPPEKLIVNLDRTGNTSAASIPVALDEAVRAGRVRRGDLSLLLAFGAGLTSGAALLRY